MWWKERRRVSGCSELSCRETMSLRSKLLLLLLTLLMMLLLLLLLLLPPRGSAAAALLVDSFVASGLLAR